MRICPTYLPRPVSEGIQAIHAESLYYCKSIDKDDPGLAACRYVAGFHGCQKDAAIGQFCRCRNGASVQSERRAGRASGFRSADDDYCFPRDIGELRRHGSAEERGLLQTDRVAVAVSGLFMNSRKNPMHGESDYRRPGHETRPSYIKVLKFMNDRLYAQS